MHRFFPALMLALLLPSAALADCRSTFGGTYALAHGGIKPDGDFHSGLAYLSVDASAIWFSVMSDINEDGGPGLHEVDIQGPYNWVTACTVHFGDGSSGMLGLVSDDGRFISIATFPTYPILTKTEFMWGTAVRQIP